MRVLFINCEGAENIISEKWFEGMSPDKKARLGRLRYEKDRNTGIAAHRLLCWGLKKEYGIVPCEDGWREGENGKPYLKGQDGVYFSISHSGQMAMCVIDKREVGADIQKMLPLDGNVAARVLSDEERRVYSDSGRDKNLFYKIWVLKEAYLKYKGSSIEQLQSITVYPVGGSITSNIPCGCDFKLIEGICGYQAAVCSEECLEFEAEYISIRDLDVI